MTPTLRERLEKAIGAQPDGLGSYFVEDPDVTTKDKLDALEQLVNEFQDKAFAHGIKKGVELRKRTDQILPPTLNQETPEHCHCGSPENHAYYKMNACPIVQFGCKGCAPTQSEGELTGDEIRSVEQARADVKAGRVVPPDEVFRFLEAPTPTQSDWGNTCPECGLPESVEREYISIVFDLKEGRIDFKAAITAINKLFVSTLATSQQETLERVVKAIETWKKQGRDYHDLWAMDNFLSGAGSFIQETITPTKL